MFARDKVDSQLLEKKKGLEEDFIRYAHKFELYQNEIERK